MGQPSWPARGVPLAWLTLEAGENDPVRFMRYLVAALQKVRPEAGQATLALLDLPQLPPVETLLTGLINDLAEISGDFVLVLDDYHCITELTVHRALEFLLEHGPENLHLVIVTRQDPLLPLARLRARRQVIEIRSSDLRFSEEESAALLNEIAGLNLTPAQVAALETRTEGWIAGLQMAALSMNGRQDIDGFLNAFSGSYSLCSITWPRRSWPNNRRKLLPSCGRPRFLSGCARPLCDAVTGRQDSQAVLRQAGEIEPVHHTPG